MSRSFSPRSSVLHLKWTHAVAVVNELITPEPRAKSLGIILDTHLPFNDHMTHVCKNSHFHLRNISKIRKFLTKESTEILIHYFASSKLDSAVIRFCMDCLPISWISYSWYKILLLASFLSPENRELLRKHDVDGGENVIWKCNFAFLNHFSIIQSHYSCKMCMLLLWNQPSDR